MTGVRRDVTKGSERPTAVKNPVLPLIGYLSCFYLAWALVWVHRVYPWATRTIGDATLIYAFINIAFRLLIWVLPVLLYLRCLDQVNVWQVSYLPPGPDVFPKRPERKSIFIKPVPEILNDVIRWSFDSGADKTGCVI